MYTNAYLYLGRVALTRPNITRILLVFTLALLCGCAAKVPVIRAWQPWIRIVESPSSIQAGTMFAIHVDGETTPLPDGDALLQRELAREIETLLSRRGYGTSGIESDYRLQVLYRTERSDKLNVVSNVRSVNYALLATGSNSSSEASTGLGVSLARSLAALSLVSANTSRQNVTETKTFIHSISIVVIDNAGAEVWTGESTWDSPELDLLTEVSLAFQLLLSGLPSDASIRPAVPEVKGTHTANHYKLACLNRWFACPALPYRIAFSFQIYDLFDGIPKDIRNPEALPAYLDLIQTAEYALPQGTEDWDDPLRMKLWSKVLLGGQYLMGPEQKPIYVLVRLTGHREGYLVEECWLATPDEFAAFEGQLSNWRDRLESYYDVFVR